jgi:hypothetical protein
MSRYSDHNVCPVFGCGHDLTFDLDEKTGYVSTGRKTGLLTCPNCRTKLVEDHTRMPPIPCFSIAGDQYDPT